MRMAAISFGGASLIRRLAEAFANEFRAPQGKPKTLSQRIADYKVDWHNMNDPCGATVPAIAEGAIIAANVETLFC